MFGLHFTLTYTSHLQMIFLMTHVLIEYISDVGFFFLELPTWLRNNSEILKDITSLMKKELC